MTPILFERTLTAPPHWWSCWWQGELRTFRDETAAEAFAKRQGLRSTFAAVDDGHDGSEQ